MIALTHSMFMLFLHRTNFEIPSRFYFRAALDRHNGDYNLQSTMRVTPNTRLIDN